VTGAESPCNPNRIADGVGSECCSSAYIAPKWLVEGDEAETRPRSVIPPFSIGRDLLE
jgi:hypothetical protein